VRTILGPPTPFPVREGSLPLCLFTPCMYIVQYTVVRLHILYSLSGEGSGGPKSYGSTETLGIYIQYSLYGLQETNPLALRVEEVCWFYTAF
jgi:hypothetical protein